MKVVLLTRITLLSGLFAMQAVAQTDVTIVTRDGQQESLFVKEDGGLYFSDDNLIVSPVQGESKTYALSSVRKLLFSQATVDLQTPESDGVLSIYPNPVLNDLNVLHLGSGLLSYSILSINGVVLTEGILSSNESIDVSTLAAGFYFLKVNGQTLKFTKL